MKADHDGSRERGQGQFFYDFHIDAVVPPYHLVRKIDKVYLHACGNVPEAGTVLGTYLAFYNTMKPQSSLDQQTPNQGLLQCAATIPVAA